MLKQCTPSQFTVEIVHWWICRPSISNMTWNPRKDLPPVAVLMLLTFFGFTHFVNLLIVPFGLNDIEFTAVKCEHRSSGQFLFQEVEWVELDCGLPIASQSNMTWYRQTLTGDPNFINCKHWGTETSGLCILSFDRVKKPSSISIDDRTTQDAGVYNCVQRRQWGIERIQLHNILATVVSPLHC